ncbi:zinc ribbon domain-containing protein [Cohnella suwonensis]|uniref:Zinc ribbon domain-containing protein n=1 Tax=Cohnella suwonensis TaxID=696072 RepID=A0ABW0LPY9_9BACL
MNFFKKLTDTVSKGVATATEKAQQTVEITKLHAQISSKRKEVDKLFASIGESVYEAVAAGNLLTAETEVLRRSEEIAVIRAEIAGLQDRIKAIRNEKDCECGKLVAEDARFCPSCGREFPAPVAAEEPSERPEQNVDAFGTNESEVEVSSVSGRVSLEKATDEGASAYVDNRIKCRHCETPLYADSHYCPACGQPTQ